MSHWITAWVPLCAITSQRCGARRRCRSNPPPLPPPAHAAACLLNCSSSVCPPHAQVCADRLLTSSDPVEALLLDGECVRRWVQKLLAVSRGRLASWLGRGVASLGSAGAPLGALRGLL